MYCGFHHISVIFVCAPIGRGEGECILCDTHKLKLDIYCQQLGDICQSDICIGIGYILHTIVEYMSVGGCLCAVWPRGDIYTLVLDIYNNWGIYVSWINILVLDVYCQQLGNVC